MTPREAIQALRKLVEGKLVHGPCMITDLRRVGVDIEKLDDATDQLNTSENAYESALRKLMQEEAITDGLEQAITEIHAALGVPPDVEPTTAIAELKAKLSKAVHRQRDAEDSAANANTEADELEKDIKVIHEALGISANADPLTEILKLKMALNHRERELNALLFNDDPVDSPGADGLKYKPSLRVHLRRAKPVEPPKNPTQAEVVKMDIPAAEKLKYLKVRRADEPTHYAMAATSGISPLTLCRLPLAAISVDRRQTWEHVTCEVCLKGKPA